MSKWFDKSAPFEYTMFVGLKQKLTYEFILEMMLYNAEFKYFDTTTRRAIDYIEFTLYNKGNLVKLRKYFKKYEVWYATKKICCCSNLASALKEINNFKNPHH